MAIKKIGGEYGDIVNYGTPAEQNLMHIWNSSDLNGRKAIASWLRAQDNNRRGIR